LNTLDEWKKEGSTHYKQETVEPIDLIVELGIGPEFALGSIIKYAARIASGRRTPDEATSDANKIKHYAELVRMLIKMEVERTHGRQTE